MRRKKMNPRGLTSDNRSSRKRKYRTKLKEEIIKDIKPKKSVSRLKMATQ